MKETIKIENEAAWLAMRHNVLTSTEISALYGLSPYKTKFELFHEKRNPLLQTEQTEFMKWGNKLESVIADAVAETEKISIKKSDVFVIDRELRIGSSFDYFVEDGRVLEIKNVRDIVFSRSWVDANGEIAPPMHISLQVQFQMMMLGISEGIVGALVGGNSLKVIHVKADRKIQESMLVKALAFWNDVDENRPPSMTEEEENELIEKEAASIIPDAEKQIDADAALEEMVRNYMSLKADQKAAGTAADLLRARIEIAAGDASVIRGQNWRASISMTKPSPGTLVTAEMVGTTIGARAGFKTLRIKEF